jgi:hypothetical protein
VRVIRDLRTYEEAAKEALRALCCGHSERVSRRIFNDLAQRRPRIEDASRLEDSTVRLRAQLDGDSPRHPIRNGHGSGQLGRIDRAPGRHE